MFRKMASVALATRFQRKRGAVRPERRMRVRLAGVAESLAAPKAER